MTAKNYTIAIIDSGCANIASVRYALERLGYEGIVTSDKAIIQSADKVILPGVGSARAAMAQLKAKDLITTIQNLTQPVIGFCLGMQLLFKHSEELDTDMLGIIPAEVIKFNETKIDIIPHMGWNNVKITPCPLLDDIKDNSHFYFVHSFHAPIGDYTIGQCEYGVAFTAIAQFKNFYGCQFHPERSGESGAKIIQNFIEGDI